MSDGIPGDEAQDREAAQRQAVDLNQLLSRIEALEAEVSYLKNKPAQYVPPPTFGPLPYQREIENIELGSDEVEAIKKQLRSLINR